MKIYTIIRITDFNIVFMDINALLIHYPPPLASIFLYLYTTSITIQDSSTVQPDLCATIMGRDKESSKHIQTWDDN